MLYNAKIKNIKDKICNVTNFATNTTLNAKISEVKSEIVGITDLATNSALKSKIPSIANLAANAAVTAAENKIPYASNLVILTIIQNLVKLKIKLLLILIMINILLLKNLTSWHQNILLQN